MIPDKSIESDELPAGAGAAALGPFVAELAFYQAATRFRMRIEWTLPALRRPAQVVRGSTSAARGLPSGPVLQPSADAMMPGPVVRHVTPSVSLLALGICGTRTTDGGATWHLVASLQPERHHGTGVLPELGQTEFAAGG